MAKDLKELNRHQINAEEDALIDFQFAMIDAMRETGMTKAELAEILGVSRARVSQLFSAGANPTLKLAARALHAVGLKNTYGEHRAAPETKSLSEDEVSIEYATVEFGSSWLSAIAASSVRTDNIASNSMKWFACQHQRKGSSSWHRKEGSVANSNGNHAMEAA